MGSLTLPDGGLIYLYTPAIIYSIETHARYWDLLEPAWRLAQQGRARLVTSDLTVMETLVAPLKARDSDLVSAFEALFASRELDLVPITRTVLREAARLRAETAGLRTPDAIHVASALLARCNLFVTNDRSLRQIGEPPMVLLDDLLPTG